MKYICTTEINASLEKVVALWNDEANFKEWQDDFKSIEHLGTTAHVKGAKSKIILDGRQRIELLETIISINLPEEKTALYEHIHMTNTQSSRFKAISDNKTLYTSEVEYVNFNGFLIKLIAKIFPSKFKQQIQKRMDQFKYYVESK